MSLDASTVFLPGRGTVFVADAPDAMDKNKLDYKTVDPSKPSTYTGWTCLGHTSRENPPALSKDGGDPDQKGSWWVEALREIREGTQWSWTCNSLQVDKDSLQFAFPGGTVRDGAFWVPSADRSVERSAFILMVDGVDRMGLYFPTTPLMIGDAPEIDIEEFFEIQLSGSILASHAHPDDRIGIYHPTFDAPSVGKG